MDRWFVATAVVVLLGLSWAWMATTAHFAINLLATYVGARVRR